MTETPVEELKRLLFGVGGDAFDPKTPSVPDADIHLGRARDEFLQIMDFRKKYGYKPERARDGATTPFPESALAFQLKGLKSNPILVDSLKELDTFNLLKPDTDSGYDQMGLWDMFEGSPIGDSPCPGIFDLKNVKKRVDPASVAVRRPCRDFAKFQGRFDQCRSDIEARRLAVVLYSRERPVKEGEFYVLSGMLVYVADVGEATFFREGIVQARLRCIIANGTEYRPLMRSFIRSLYKEKGSRVSATAEGIAAASATGQTTGYVYILKSLSSDVGISSIRDLHKIGFTESDVGRRIANACNETTYLCAAVEIVATFRVENISPMWIEQKIHALFDHVRLDVRMEDAAGIRYRPQEWFVVPVDAIRDGINAIVDCGAPPVRYDAAARRIVRV